MINLKEIPTKELVKELANREEQIIAVDPHEKFIITTEGEGMISTGPAQVIIVRD